MVVHDLPLAALFLKHVCRDDAPLGVGGVDDLSACHEPGAAAKG